MPEHEKAMVTVGAKHIVHVEEPYKFHCPPRMFPVAMWHIIRQIGQYLAINDDPCWVGTNKGHKRFILTPCYRVIDNKIFLNKSKFKLMATNEPVYFPMIPVKHGPQT